MSYEYPHFILRPWVLVRPGLEPTQSWQTGVYQTEQTGRRKELYSVQEREGLISFPQSFYDEKLTSLTLLI